MNPENAPHMVQQIIKYSDGTETVINYRGVIKDGVLTEDNPDVLAEKKPGIVEQVKRAYKKRVSTK